MLAVAARRLGGEADLRLVSGTKLPFQPDSFDLVTASMVLHEVPADQRVAMLSEMVRVAKPGPSVLITDFRFGSLRGFKGPIFKAVSYAIEAVSGHFSGFRSFRAGGGIPGLATHTGVPVVDQKPVSGGNIGFYVVGDPG